MITELTIDEQRVLVRHLVIAAVENPLVGDWAAYVVDIDHYDNGAETIAEYAKRNGDKVTEEEALRYFGGPQCPRGPYRP